MRIIQLNLNHCEAAQCLLEKNVQEIDGDVAILSEPYENKDLPCWKTDSLGSSALWSIKRAQIVDSKCDKTGFVRAVISGITMYSCYLPPRFSIEEYQNIIDTLVMDAAGRKNILIAGDFNAWATEWGSSRSNARGKILLEALAGLDVVLLNTGNQNTFNRNGAGSIIDVAFVSSSIYGRVNWQISNIYTQSDHDAIIIDINNPQFDQQSKIQRKMNGWKNNPFEKEMFEACMINLKFEGPPSQAAAEFIRRVTNACNMSLKKRKSGTYKNEVYWWNENIAELRRECIKARRKFTRSRGRPDNFVHHDNLRKAKKALKVAIKQSKRACFLDICDDLENNPFGLAYKIVMKKLKQLNSAIPSDPKILVGIVTHLFPPQGITEWDHTSSQVFENFPPVSIEELQLAASKLKDKKAPGPDGIPNMVVKELIKCCPNYLVDLFNSCFRCGTFPDIWKRQKLVLLPKGNKPPEDPSSYRPICLIDTCGKLLESIICARLCSSVEAANGLSEYQYGFRKSRSTIDAIKTVVDLAERAIRAKDCNNDYCIVVTLDIKNAFNTANWEKTVRALQYLHIPQYLVAMIQDYFSKRILTYETDEGTKKYNVTGGVPQGSVLGPLLWNVMYDGVLNLNLPLDAKVIGFADDIALVIKASSLEQTSILTEASVALIKKWLTSMGLTLADHKTEAVLISSRKSEEFLAIKVGDCEITTKKQLKYLGVMIDNRLNFKAHLEYVAEKAKKTATSLCRILPNTRGPKHSRRKVITAVVSNIILYAAPVWADSLKYKTYVEKISSVYRIGALRVCCAYRTVSDDAACVISGMIPIDLLAKERQYLYKRQYSPQEARSKIMEEWQSRWDSSSKGRWTYSLIPNIKKWVERKHGDPDYYITQFLTGHGGFKQYLHRFCLDDSPFCPYCNDAIQDSQHIFFDCQRFTVERHRLETQLQESVRVDNIIDIMVGTLESWGCVSSFVRFVLLELIGSQRTLE